MAEKNKEKSIDEMIQKETAHRIAEMQSTSYKFPPRIMRIDVVGIVATICVCLILIVLCMMGVIA